MGDADTAAAAALFPGVRDSLFPPSESASTSSPGPGRLTPDESSDGESRSNGYRDEAAAAVAADPLLGGNGDGDDGDEVYELSEGVRGGGRGGDGGGGGAEKSHDGFTYTAEEERAVVRKFDRRLVLFVALLYMLSFLDRSNIGNAYVAGMDEDLLERTGAKDGSGYYEWALSSFYVAYITFEWMSLLWSRIPAHTYITAIVLSWGVIASLQAISTSYPMLIFLRFLLGIGEAGFTGIPIYLSFFFKREELALRTAIFISAAPLATAFASSLAWLITKLGEKGPIAPWRLLFLLEGFPGVLAATVAYRVIPDTPARASYLSKREKRIARSRLDPSLRGGDNKHEADEGGNSNSAGGRGWWWRVLFSRETLSVLRDPVPWTTAGIFCLTNMAYASLPVFLPSILTQMGHTPLASQALSVPPYLIAFVAVLAVARASDALRSRAYLIAGCALLSSMGYAFLALSHGLSDRLDLHPSPGPAGIEERSGKGGHGGNGGGNGGGFLDTMRYLAVYPAAAGFFCVVVLTIAWNVNNARGGGAHNKGAGFALMQMLGQCGPLVGTRLYPKTDGPWFTRGMSVCAVAMFVVAVLALGLRAYLARVNRRLLLEGEGRDGGLEEEEGLVGRRGGGHHRKRFQYML